MCLNLTETSVRDTKRMQSRVKPIKAYKVLLVTSENQMISPYWGSLYDFGINRCNRYKKMTKAEVNMGYVDEGLHVFLNLEDTVSLVRARASYHAFPCLVNPKDVVAVGMFRNTKSMVVKKLTLLKSKKPFGSLATIIYKTS